MSSSENWREWLREWGVPASVTSKEPSGAPLASTPAPVADNLFFGSEPAGTPTPPAAAPQPSGAAMSPKLPQQPQQPKQPKQPMDPEKKKLFKNLGFAALFVVPLIVVVVLVAVLVPDHDKSEEPEPSPTPTAAVEKWCEPRTGNPYVSDAGGPTDIPQGVLAEMWRQYLGLRSASGYYSLTNGQWLTEESIASQIAREVPEKKVEWCTTITPLEENWWKVQVHWRTLDKTVEKKWISDYSTAEIPGQGYVVTGTRRNAELQRELAEKKAKESRGEEG